VPSWPHTKTTGIESIQASATAVSKNGFDQGIGATHA
jgi:hypothetical protein